MSRVDAQAVQADVLRRARDPQRERWEQQVAGTGHCARPVRISGRIVAKKGDGRVLYSTAVEPDRELMVRCGNRRDSVCPSCSREYRGDMWQLLYAGCVGGRKGVPEGVAEHPMAFITLTAPSFGPVHTARADGSCHPRRADGCTRMHAVDDLCLGEALDPFRYDYEAAVLFNWHAPELWRRFTIALRRELASHLAVGERELSNVVRLSFAKVAEFQRRGVVHFHGIIRLDGPDDDDPPRIDSSDLEELVRRAAGRPEVDSARAWTGEVVSVRFGAQVDVRPLTGAGADRDLDPGAAAAYISKYATKAAEDLGVGGRRLSPADLDTVDVREHVRRMLFACFALERTCPGISRWAHMLGFRGHFSSKSRRFSTTLTELRAARALYRRQAAGGQPEGQGEWVFRGVGYRNAGDSALAAAARTHAAERRERLRWGPSTEAAA